MLEASGLACLVCWLFGEVLPVKVSQEFWHEAQDHIHFQGFSFGVEVVVGGRQKDEAGRLREEAGL